MDSNSKRHSGYFATLLRIFTIQICVGVSTTQAFILSGTTLGRYITIRPELREISREITLNGLGYLLDSPNITVFLPDNDAMARFSEIQSGNQANYSETLRNLILYHSVDQRLTLRDIHDNFRIRSRTRSPTMLYFNTFTTTGGKAIHTINGAKITPCAFQAESGALFLIDRVLSPVGSSKTINEYDSSPDLPYLSFTSITALAEINQPLFQQANSDQHFFTVFSPNDSYTYAMPPGAQEVFYRDWDLINNTIKAHIIKDEVLCLPHEGHIPDMTALTGKLKFSRRDGKVYVENSRVRAEVIIPNIPLRNGVLHVIDTLLFYIYDNVYQRLQQLPEAQTFNAVSSSITTLTNKFKTNPKMTVFVPVSSAFAKISPRIQGAVQANTTTLTQLLNSHVIVGQDLEIDDLLRMGDVTTVGNRSIRLTSMDNDIYIHHNGMRSKVIRPDIGCTNGIIHLINDVMIDSWLTIWENIESQSQLSFVHEYMRNHIDLRRTLSSTDGSYVTAFLPGTVFMQGLPDYSLDMFSASGSQLYQALMGHIIEGARFGSFDFKDGVQRKLISKNGNFLFVTRRGHEIHVNGSHVNAIVQVSDIWCSNGVIHIIDKILHIPSRHALDELKHMFDTRSAANMFSASEEIRHLLSDNSSRITVFVPTDKALSKIPLFRTELLRQDPNLLYKFIRSHVLNDQVLYTPRIPSEGEVFNAEEGKVRISRSHDKLYVKNNGVGAWFKMTDVPVINGVIHVIESPLWFTYRSVEEELVTNPDLMQFYSLISGLSDTVSTIQPQLPVTIFAPSAAYFSSIENKMALFKEDRDIHQKLFDGHVMPSTVADSNYFASRQQLEWRVTTFKNVTFRFTKETPAYFTVGVLGDHTVNIQKAEIRCVNGVIYLIDELLNYSPYSVQEVAEMEANLRNVFASLVRRSWSSELSSSGQEYTILAPDDVVSQTQGSIFSALLNNATLLQEVTWRHISLGEKIRMDDFLNGSIGNNFSQNNVLFYREGDNVFVSWRGVKARVLQSNVLTNNGIIHIVDKILYESESPSTPVVRTTSVTRTTRGTRPTPVTRTTAKFTERPTATQNPRTGMSSNTSNGACLATLHISVQLLTFLLLALW